MSEELHRTISVVNEKLDALWKDYATLFNDYNPLLEDFQREKMDFLLQEIRTLEKKRERIQEQEELHH